MPPPPPATDREEAEWPTYAWLGVIMMLMRHKPRLQDPCWETDRVPNNSGYKQLSLRGQGFRGEGHRFFYEVIFGPIPDGYDIDHLCGNRGCWNPWHMEAVTRLENLVRGDTAISERLSRDHCINGHEYTDENTYVYKGARLCRQCRADAERRRRRTNKEMG